MRLFLLAACFSLLPVLGPSPVLASTPEMGAIARGFFTSHGRFGNFYGVEARLKTTGPMFLGVSGFGGPVLNALPSALGYGGVLAGARTVIPGGAHVSARLWAGGGGGRLNGLPVGAFALEPSVAIGLPVSDRVVGSLSLGYLTMLGVQNVNGLVIAFRADL